jgi:hypothetical protein
LQAQEKQQHAPHRRDSQLSELTLPPYRQGDKTLADGSRASYGQMETRVSARCLPVGPVGEGRKSLNATWTINIQVAFNVVSDKRPIVTQGSSRAQSCLSGDDCPAAAGP